MKALWTIWIFLTLTAFVEPHNTQGSNSAQDSSIVILSDTQFSSPFQFWDENNAPAVAAVVDEACRQRTSLAVFLGDVTNYGDSDHEWSRFDTLTQRLFAAVPRRLAALGNHDYYGSNEPALNRFFARFPALKRRLWSDHQWNGLGIILLNSNFGDLTSGQQRDQRDWLRTTLQQMDADSAVKAVVVAFHHSPYSNNIVVGSNENVQQQFVPLVLKSSKAVVILSGHAHTYEHFFLSGRHYIVAGGCGPRHPVNRNRATRPYDDLYNGGRIRPHHFCTIRLSGSSFVLEMHQRDDISGRWTIGDSLHFPPP